VGADSERDAFRGTSAHNTLAVDGVDQTEPKGPFGWTKLPDVKMESWIKGHSFDLFVGSHDGYCRLEWGMVHRRWVFSLKGQFWLVRDMALGSGEHQLDLFWHLSPGLSAGGSGADTFIEESGRAGLRVLAVEGHDWLQEVREAWWSPVYGRKEPAQVLHFATTTKLPAEFVTLLEPVADASIRRGRLSRMRQSSKPGLVRGYHYATPRAEHRIFFSQGNAWTLGRWSSDAELLYWGRSADGARQVLICCNGTYVEASGRKLVSSRRQLLRCEIISAGEQVDVFSSDEDAMVSKEALPNLSTESEPVLTAGLPGSGKTGL
jgi:Heparinase II/III-like protein